MSLSYESSGVKYGPLDAFKRACQKAALTTSQEEESKTQVQFQADIDRYKELRAAQAAAIR